MTDRFVTVPDSLELPAAVKVPVARLVGPTGAAGVLTNDGAGTLTWEAASGSLDTEAVQDVVGAMVTAAGGTYDDAAGSITLPGGAVDSVNGQTGAVNLDGTYATRELVEVTLTSASQAITLPAGTTAGNSVMLIITADGGTPAWPSNLLWDFGVAPTLSAVPGERDVLVAYRTATEWLGFQAGQFAATYDSTSPSVPAALTATASGTSVDLAWTASTDNVGVTGYEYRIDGGAAVDAGAGTSETVAGLNGSTTYTFEVRAYDAAGNRSGWSAPANATTDAVLSYRTAALALNPYTYLRLDEPVGSATVADLGSGNRTHTPTNVTLGVPGIGDGATAATGASVSSGQIFSANSAPAWDGTETGGTIAALIKPNAANCGIYQAKTKVGFGVISGTLSMKLNAVSTWITGTGATVTTGQTTHVAATFDGTNVKFYVNGSLASTVANTNLTGLTAIDEDIWGIDGSRWLNGTLAGCVTLRRAASGAEILSLAQAAGLA